MYKRIQPTETVDLPGNLPTRLCESKMTDELTVLLFCDVHIDKGATLNLLQCLHVMCGSRVVQTNSAETPLAPLHIATCTCTCIVTIIIIEVS